MKNALRPVVALLLLLSIGLTGCKGGGSPTAPDGPPSPKYPVIDLKKDLAVGAVHHEVLPAGKQFPLEFGLSEIKPAKGSQLVVDQIVSLSWICGSAQGGYQAIVLASFVTDPPGVASQPELRPRKKCSIGGSPVRVGLRCDSVNGTWFRVQADTPNIAGVNWEVWLSPDGVPFDDRDRCPDAEIFESLNLKGPGK